MTTANLVQLLTLAASTSGPLLYLFFTRRVFVRLSRIETVLNGLVEEMSAWRKNGAARRPVEARKV